MALAGRANLGFYSNPIFASFLVYAFVHLSLTKQSSQQKMQVDFPCGQTTCIW
jgi:hypothetical protein